MDSYYLLRNWRRNVMTGRRAGRRLGPERYLEVHYEEFVQAPADSVRKLCRFLGEEYVPGMLEHAALAREQIGPKGHVEVLRPISTSSVQRWRAEMPAFQQKLANAVTGTALTAVGYDLATQSSWSIRESIRLLSLRTKYTATDVARRFLPALGIPTLNRDMRKRGLGAMLRGVLSLPW